jgi:diphthine-ammonia ligase
MTLDTNKSIAGRPFFCSWSGGKDPCLALYRAIREGGKPHSLLTILSEDGVTYCDGGRPIFGTCSIED